MSAASPAPAEGRLPGDDGAVPDGRRRPSRVGRADYPLSALVGQEDLIEALLVCAVHPVVGGVLVRGERGTAKSTAVRALAPMLRPGDDAVPAPLVDLPLGATLDRLVGTLDLRAALQGEHRVEAGLLGRADGGVLYVDEVNLLPDHLVDVLLDAAASGEVTVERDGVSVVQDARFLLVGTMNPEEGELRPQLLDRFGLGVEVTGPRDPAVRAAIVRRRMAYDADPVGFAAEWADHERALAERITVARERVRSVILGERELRRITDVCARLDLDGVRGDLVCAQAARALAALDGADAVDDAHVERAAHLALRHRLHRDPLAPPPDGDGEPAIDDALEQSETAAAEDERSGPQGETERSAMDDGHGDGAGDAGDHRPDPGPAARERSSDTTGHDAIPATPPPTWSPDPDLAGAPPPPEAAPPRIPEHLGRPAPVPSRLPEAALELPRGTRGPRVPDAPAGRAPGGTLAVLDARAARDGDPIAVLPTVLDAVRSGAIGQSVVPHTAIVGGGRGTLLCLIVDTSGSMAARRRLSRVKGALEVALRRAYARRDQVAVVAFSGHDARTLVTPGAPLEQAAAAISALPAGGRTPLGAGIDHAAVLLADAHRGRAAGRARVAVLLTDGRAPDPEGRAPVALRRLRAATDRTVVVDLEEGPVRLGLAARLAAAAGADLTRLIAPEHEHRRPPDRRSAA
ncbi:MAG: VWA domain-containing protein [Solirubrobacteraceae bacterium]